MGLGRKGVAAVEFALVAPVVALMLMGVIEETSLLRAQLKLSHAAGLLGKMVAQQTTAVTAGTGGSLGNLCYGAGLMMAPMSRLPFASAIASVTNSALTGVTAMDWETDLSCAKAATAIGAVAAAGLATSTGLVPSAGDSLIIVRSSYVYTANTHFILAATYTLTQTIYVRPRVNTTIACTNCGLVGT